MTFYTARLPSEEDRATATENTYRKYGEIWTCGFGYASGQTDRQTHRHADHNTSHPSWDEVIILQLLYA